MPPRHSDHENILISHVYIMDPLVLFLKVGSGCSRPVSVVHNLRTHRLSPLEVTTSTDDQDILCFILHDSLGGSISNNSEIVPQRGRGGISGYDKI